MKLSTFISAVLFIAVGAAGGWWIASNYETPPKPTPSTEPAPLRKVVAQGRLLPYNGLINIVAPPGQRIREVLVEEGHTVKQDQELVTFAGQEVLDLQTSLIESQGQDAQLELDQKILAAEGSLLAAANGLEAARLQLNQLNESSQLAVAEKQLKLAREKLDRLKKLSLDPATKLYVAQTSLDDQILTVEQAQTSHEHAQRQHENAVTAAKLNLELAEKTQQHATSALKSLQSLREQNLTLEISKSIAQTNAANSKIGSPVDGTVLKVNGKAGEVMVNAPVMQIGDLTRMVCVAEVVDRLVDSVQHERLATISSPALSRPIRGRVISIGRVVGTGSLVDPNPLAVVDKRTVDVRIEIDGNDVAVARELVNLQVTVEIEVESENQPGTGKHP